MRASRSRGRRCSKKCGASTSKATNAPSTFTFGACGTRSKSSTVIRPSCTRFTALAINSPDRNRLLAVADVWQRAGAVARLRPVPLLAVRLPEFERIAWRSGRRVALVLERQTSAAFEDAVDASLRAGDLIAHDPGSDA